jgi:nitrite reductase (NADH) large subunit
MPTATSTQAGWRIFGRLKRSENMPKVTFKSDGKSVDVPAGTQLTQVAEDNGASIPFSCKAGVCVSCLVTITKGLENLSPPTENEKATLEGFGAKPNQRLACQVVVNGDVEIENP